MSRVLDLTQGRVEKNLMSMALPMAVGILAVIGFNWLTPSSCLNWNGRACSYKSDFSIISALQSLTMGLVPAYPRLYRGLGCG